MFCLTPRSLFAGLLILFCLSSSDAGARGSSLPDWTRNPPRDSAVSFYGVGEGTDLKAARADGLASIAETIEIEVAKIVIVEQGRDNDGFYEDFDSEIRTQVRDIKLSSFHVDEIAREDDRTYVLIRVDRADLAATRLTRLEEIDSALVQSMTEFGSESPFSRRQEQGKLKKQLRVARATLTVLNWAAPDFADDSFRKRYIDYASQIARVDKEFKVRVISEPSGRLLSEAIVDLLKDKDVRASLSGSGESETTVHIKTRKIDVGSDLDGAKSVSLHIDVKTVDSKGGSIEISKQMHAQSLASESIAESLAWTRLIEKCKGDGVFAFLGWKTNQDSL